MKGGRMADMMELQRRKREAEARTQAPEPPPTASVSDPVAVPASLRPKSLFEQAARTTAPTPTPHAAPRSDVRAPAPEAIASEAIAPSHSELWRDAIVASEAIAPEAIAQEAIASHAIAPEAIDPLAGVKHVDGYLAVPNTIMDSLWEILDPIDMKVYLRLFRLSHGHKNPTCRVGYGTLAKSCKLSPKGVQAAVGRLESLGLIRRLDQGALRGTQMQVGNEYLVRIPGSIAPEAIAREAIAPGANNKKNSLKENIKAPVAVAPAPELSVYDVRRIAARFRELHHGESGYTKDRLRADVRTALIGEGREPDDRLIDEAIG
jgi:hypothetical protein